MTGSVFTSGSFISTAIRHSFYHTKQKESSTILFQKEKALGSRLRKSRALEEQPATSVPSVWIRNWGAGVHLPAIFAPGLYERHYAEHATRIRDVADICLSSLM